MTITNDIDPTALEQTIDAVRSNPRLGQVTFSVSGEWTGGFRLQSSTGPLRQGDTLDESRTGRFSMSSDEPTALLGTDSAVSPGEYIAQALAGCYAVTLAASATALGINLRAMAMDIEIDFDLRAFLGIETTTPAGARTIRAQVKLDAPDSSPEQLKKLMGLLEQRSPIRDTLTRAVEVITTLESL
ncbi:hypothetical protein GCM10009715_41440 [Paeniglutamicibacter psychrophenolicus]